MSSSFIADAPSLAHALHRALLLRGDLPFLGQVALQPVPGVQPSAASRADLRIEWTHTFASALRESVDLASALIDEFNVPRGARVGICSVRNRPEWVVTDFACVLDDLISVGLHASWSDATTIAVLADSGCSVVVCDGESAVRLLRLCAEHEGLEGLAVAHVVVMDLWCRPGEDFISHFANPPTSIIVRRYSSLISCSSARRVRTTYTGAGILLERPAVLPPPAVPIAERDQICTLMYTSGTSGVPKGVCVTRGSFRVGYQASPFSGQDEPRIMSYMALAHGADRGLVWSATLNGASVVFSRCLDDPTFNALLADIGIVRPSYMLGLSHFWGSLYSLFLAQVEEEVLAHDADFCDAVVRAASFVGSVCDNQDDRRETTVDEQVTVLREHMVLWQSLIMKRAARTGARELVLRRFRESYMGGLVRKAVTGGAHTAEVVIEFMNDLFTSDSMRSGKEGTNVFNAYGSTEFPGIAVNGVFGPNVDWTLDDMPERGYCCSDTPHPRGELLVRERNSPPVSYWNQPDSTAAVVDMHGWYHTGDIGEIDMSRPSCPLLSIIDRKTNVVELYDGGDSVWVAVEQLENRVYRPLATHACQQIYLDASDRNAARLVAVVVPNRGFLAHWCKRHRFDVPNNLQAWIQLCDMPTVRQYVLDELVAIAHSDSACWALGRPLSHYEVPAAVLLVADRWTNNNGGLSAIGKIARAFLSNQVLKSRLMAIYADLERHCEAPTSEDPHRDTELNSEQIISPSIAASRMRKVVDLLDFRHHNDDIPHQPAGIGRVFVEQPVPTSGDYIDFAFSFPDSLETKRTNKYLDDLKIEIRKLRANICTWDDAIGANHEVSEKLVDETHATHSEKIKRAIRRLETSRDNNTDPVSLVSELRCAFEESFIAMTLAHEHRRHQGRITKHKDHLDCLANINSHIARLQFNLRHEVHSCRLPKWERWMGELFAGGVFRPPVMADDDFQRRMVGKSSLVSMSVGSYESFCYLTGQRIQLDDGGLGTIRWHSLDAENITYSHLAYDVCIRARRALLSFGLFTCLGGSVTRALALLDKFDPFTSGAMARESDVESALVDHLRLPLVEGSTFGEPSSQLSSQKLPPLLGSLLETVTGNDIIYIDWLGGTLTLHVDLAACRVSTLRQFVAEKLSATTHPLNNGASSLVLGRNVLEGGVIGRDDFGLLNDFSLRDAGIQPESVLTARDRATLRQVSRDTPATVLARAVILFSCRLCLGIPDPDDNDARIERQLRFRAPNRSYGRSALIDALPRIARERESAFADACRFGLSTGVEASSGQATSRGVPPPQPDRFSRVHDGYTWLTFGHIGWFARRLARVLRGPLGLDLGDAVGICGFNSVEWAVCDFACCLGGLRAIGLHATFSTATAAAVLKSVPIVALFCAHELILSRSDQKKAAVDIAWSVPSVESECPELRHVIVMDGPAHIQWSSDQRSSDKQDHREERVAHHWLPQLIESDKFDSTSLDDPRNLPAGGPDATFTLLFTSGSAGIPKSVRVSARAFLNDISDPSTSNARPLITASYIPLSHSSDRYKMWEFVRNGGRVGFAFYPASNWSEHEVSKKSSMVRSFGSSSNNVETLLEQVCALGPTAMSCPPRIWNGLYFLFCRQIQKIDQQENIDEIALRYRRKIAEMFGPRICNLATGGAPTSPVVIDFARSLRAVLPKVSFTESYGTTETGAITSNGRVCSSKGVELEIIAMPFDNEHPKPAAKDERGCQIGEAVVYSPNMSDGYFQDRSQTAKAFGPWRLAEYNDNRTWYRTGDVVELNPLGLVKVLGRLSEQHIVNGRTLFPCALAEIFQSSPLLVAGGIWVTVVAQQLCAVVVPRASAFPERKVTPADIRQSLEHIAKHQNVASHEIPGVIIIQDNEWPEGMHTISFKKDEGAFQSRYCSALQSLAGE